MYVHMILRNMMIYYQYRYQCIPVSHLGSVESACHCSCLVVLTRLQSIVLRCETHGASIGAAIALNSLSGKLRSSLRELSVCTVTYHQH